MRVVDAGSFAEAARRWGRSKAVVGKYVAQLEAHLDLRLLTRTTRTLSLTDAGRVHLEQCRHVLGTVEAGEARLRADQVAPSGRLRVSAPPGFFSLHWHTLTAGFVARYPDVRLELDLTHRFVDVVEERVDVAIRLTDPDDSSLIARRLADAPLVLVASPDYLSERGVPERPGDLVGHDCLVDTNIRFGRRWPVGEGRAVEVEGPVEANDPLLLVRLAEEGLGVALTARMIAHDSLAAGRVVEILPGAVRARWSVWAITSERRYLPARARVFIEHLRAHLAA